MSVTARDDSVVLRDREAVRGYVEKVCFKTGPPGLVGAELEWIVVRRGRPGEPVPLERLHSLVDDAPAPPRGSIVTFEPGGQVELSSLPFPGPSVCWAALDEDARHLHEILDGAHLVPLTGPVFFLLIGAALFFRGRRLAAFWHRMDRRDSAGAATEPSGPISS